MKRTCCNLGNRASGGAQCPYSVMVGVHVLFRLFLVNTLGKW